MSNIYSHLDYYGERRPAGDAGFFDFLPIGNQALAASIGEVSGTGSSAAILMSGIQSTLRGLTADGRGNIGAIVQELNRAVYGISPDVFFPTLFYARIDPLLRQLQYVSAGYETALLVRKDATRVHRLERTGTVLGLTNQARYGRRTLTFDPGDLVIAFTDGLVGSCEAAILDAVRRRPGAGASEIVGLVDDRTVIAVRYTGAAAKAWLEAAVEEPMFAAA